MSVTSAPAVRLSLVAAILAACTTGRVAPLEQDRGVITAPELADTRAGSTYEAIKRLRPLFLGARGPSSILVPGVGGPAVFVDHTLLGGVEALIDLPLTEVERIRFVSSWDATTRYGSGYAHGVIEVTTRTGPASAPRRPAP